MAIKYAKFMCSSEKLTQCPPAEIDGTPVVEVAFIGRSNVGKSSLINMLVNQKLAKVSGTPGKTRLINHFEVNSEWMLVDLPGYGYAKTSKSDRLAFGELINSYVINRHELYCLFVLVDIRLEPQKIDVQFMEMLGENGVPFAIIFTKGDKLSATARKKQVEAYRAKIEEQWEEFPPHFVTSSESGLGKDALVDYIEAMVTELKESL
ncbi:MAG: ribosome biogenesis GTP-binding protein YihA/YsxC [Rikenellaceae bacterium]